MVAASFRRARWHPDCGSEALLIFDSNKKTVPDNAKSPHSHSSSSQLFVDTEEKINNLTDNPMVQKFAKDFSGLKTKATEDFIDKSDSTDFKIEKVETLLQNDNLNKVKSEQPCDICLSLNDHSNKVKSEQLSDILHKHHCINSGSSIDKCEMHENNKILFKWHNQNSKNSSSMTCNNEKMCVKPDLLKCEIHSCSFTTKYKTALHIHMLKKHTGEKGIKCDLCSYRCHMKRELKKHMVTHDPAMPYACNFPSCKYACKLSSNLRKHKRTHTQERPYACEQCSFSSNFISSLKTHKRLHTGERPFCCDQCGYRCNSSSNLKKHMVQKHDHTGERLFCCD